MSSLSVFAFDASGNLLVRRSFTSEEVTAKKATFALPKTAAGTSVEFYAVGNAAVGEINMKPELLALTETSASDYNGTFADVTTKGKRPGGFLMSGTLTKTVAAAGSSTDVSIVLKRSVAKIALQATLSADFTSKYPGKVKISSATLSKGASQTPYIGGAALPGAMTFASTQATAEASGNYNNLFYCFENGALSAGSRVMATLEGLYDKDGNFTTTSDQIPVTYTVELTGTTGGQIHRNGYYRVAVSIAGLTGQDVNAIITVADWESPVTQSINLGQ